ncbi:MAG: hypothetical protein JOZ09_07445 [Pseudonocardiales bacterium]|nr:hypothetical protein [Pseudonocardiales bacterium]
MGAEVLATALAPANTVKASTVHVTHNRAIRRRIIVGRNLSINQQQVRALRGMSRDVTCFFVSAMNSLGYCLIGLSSRHDAGGGLFLRSITAVNSAAKLPQLRVTAPQPFRDADLRDGNAAALGQTARVMHSNRGWLPMAQETTKLPGVKKHYWYRSCGMPVG